MTPSTNKEEISAKLFMFNLPFELAKLIVDACEREYLLPRQVMEKEMNLPLSEPIIYRISAPAIVPLRESRNFDELRERCNTLVGRSTGATTVYLSILSQTVDSFPDEFLKIVPTLRVKGRVFVGTREEVENFERSKAAQIPKTEWFANINQSPQMSGRILSKVLKFIGCSDDYTAMVQAAPLLQWPRLKGVYFAEQSCLQGPEGIVASNFA